MAVTIPKTEVAGGERDNHFLKLQLVVWAIRPKAEAPLPKERLQSEARNQTAMSRVERQGFIEAYNGIVVATHLVQNGTAIRPGVGIF